MTLHTLDDIVSFELFLHGPDPASEADIVAAVVRKAAPNSGIGPRDICVWPGPDGRSFRWRFRGDKRFYDVKCVGETYEECRKSAVTQLATAIMWEVAHN